MGLLLEGFGRQRCRCGFDLFRSSFKKAMALPLSTVPLVVPCMPTLIYLLYLLWIRQKIARILTYGNHLKEQKSTSAMHYQKLPHRNQPKLGNHIYEQTHGSHQIKIGISSQKEPTDCKFRHYTEERTCIASKAILGQDFREFRPRYRLVWRILGHIPVCTGQG